MRHVIKNIILLLSTLCFIHFSSNGQPYELQKMKQTLYRTKLTIKPNEININEKGSGVVQVSFSFPRQYFVKNAYMQIEPSINFGSNKRPLRKILLKGEKANGNYPEISYKKGGTKEFSIFFKYEKEMRLSANLMLEISVFYSPYDNVRQKVFFQPVVKHLILVPPPTEEVASNTTKEEQKDPVKDYGQDPKISPVSNLKPPQDTIVAIEPEDSVKDPTTEIPDTITGEDEEDLFALQPIVGNDRLSLLLRQTDSLLIQYKHHEAIRLLEEEKVKYEQSENTKTFEYINLKLAELYQLSGRYDRAVDQYILLQDMFRTKGLKTMQLYIQQQIALMYFKLNDLKQSEYFFNQIIEIDTLTEKLMNKNINNLAVVYGEDEQLQKAVQMFDNTLSFFAKRNDKTAKAKVLNNKANILFYQKDYNTAIEYYHQSLGLKEALKDTLSKAISHYNIAKAYERTGKIIEAVNNFEKSLDLATMANLHELIRLNNLQLAELKTEGKFTKAGTHYRNFAGASLFTYQKTKVIFEFILSGNLEISVLYKELNQTKLNLMTQKAVADAQKREIELLETDHKFKNEKLRRKNTMLFSLGALLLIFLFFIVLIYRQYHFKKKANSTLTKQNGVINQQNEEVRTQNEALFQQKEEIKGHLKEIEKQRNTISEQNEELKQKTTRILDSINYALKIQTAILLPPEQLNDIFNNNSFLMFMPCDIVSGDFYWARKVGDYTYFTVVDCTGHGVPGGFMSMLGMSFLNESINDNLLPKPAELLEEMRAFIKQSLRQSGKAFEAQDGMDMAFCRLHNKTSILEFCGAYNPLYIYRGEEFIELKADRMPVGIHPWEQKFTNHSIQLQKNDMCYLFSDGFHSQLKSVTYEKFKTRRFKELLKEIAHLPLVEQNTILVQKLERWRGEVDQVDDVTVFGLRVC